MKRIFATIKIAVRALRRNLLRTLLTMLGMIIGVGAVIAMVGIGNGAKAQIESQVAAMGQNVVLVYAGSMNRGGVRSGYGGTTTLTVDDAEAIQREIVGVSAVSPEIRTRAQITEGNQNWNTQILGESPEYFDIRQWPIISGTGFSEQDVRSASKVAVIGKTIADQLFPGEDPLGQVFRIKNVPFVIMGMLAPKGFSVQGQDQDDLIIMPYTSVMKRLQRPSAQGSLGTINVQAATPSLLNPVQQQIIELLRQRHKIRLAPGDQPGVAGSNDDFMVRNQQEIAEMATAQSKTMTLLLGAIAMVSLVVGGIGIMNIMLVSVTERTREIGIRMAIGARGRDILLQFLTEAVTLGVVGGILGVGAGVGASRLLSANMGWPTLVPFEWVIYAFFFSAAVGIFFGFYPARKASQLDPIDALRYE
jgi:putative ABC transport system permease protein